ncbi:MAG: hypothetical protein K8U57_34430 [Planctomycetes bacterium]|nr:hypothetical protein [Planctomycetota bacterium]
MAKQKPESSTTTPDAPKPDKITQSEAVKRAVAAGKGQPTEGVQYIKDNFKMEMTNQSFSTVKSKLNKGTGTTGKRGRPPGPAKAPAPAPASKPASASTPAHTNGKPTTTKTGDPAELALAVKNLVAQYGVETVKAMADVFAS